jgi:hypothetical protein
MSAAVARRACLHRLAFGHGLLRQSGQRVELADEREDGGAAAPRRNKRGRDLGHARFDRKACLAEVLLQKRAALVLLIADLRVLPDLMGELSVSLASGIEPREDRIRPRLRWREPQQNEHEEQHRRPHQVINLRERTVQIAYASLRR